MKINLETLPKSSSIEYLKQGAEIRFSPTYKVANLWLNGDIVGRVHLATFNSLFINNKIHRTNQDGDYDYYLLNSPVNMEVVKK